jgi:hypothetical protein
MQDRCFSATADGLFAIRNRTVVWRSYRAQIPEGLRGERLVRAFVTIVGYEVYSLRRGYMIQTEEQAAGRTVGLRSASRRQEIRSNNVSTLKPWSRSSIICSRLNPACSPAMANFPIAATKEGFSILLPPNFSENRTGLSDRP